MEKINLCFLGMKVIKNRNNNGDLTKQYFKLFGEIEKNPALHITSYYLSKDKELYKDCILVKSYKDKFIFKRQYSIKLGTLGDVVSWIEVTMAKHIKNEVCSINSF